MKKKINIQLLILVVFAISITLIMSIGVFYSLFQRQVLKDLGTYTHVLAESGFFEEKDYAFEMTEETMRITLVDTDGSVYYDSSVEKEQLDNHKNRPEIKKALIAGEGEDIRHSETLDRSTFYYALKLDNGMILRVSKEAESIWSVCGSVFPIIGAFTLVVLGLCLGLAQLMTKSLVAPIEQLATNLEDGGTLSTYKELVPFINTIQKQHEDIIKSSKMRQEFTANVSHELKTPLTAISGYAELIESGMASGDEMRHFAGAIHQNSNRLLTLINDIIQLSELDSTEVEIDFAPVDLYQVVKSTVEMLKMSASQHGIEISIQGDSCLISANKAMMEEVVMNLCDNAIRYNNKGGSVKVVVKTDDKHAILSIKDTGIGISQENQERIFERFYRVDKSRSKSTGGTGLGLAIVKHIVSKHQAYLEIESELGKGTEIKVIFNRLEQNDEA